MVLGAISQYLPVCWVNDSEVPTVPTGVWQHCFTIAVEFKHEVSALAGLLQYANPWQFRECVPQLVAL